MNPFSRPLNTIALILTIVMVVSGIIIGLQLSNRTLSMKLSGSNYTVTLYDGTKEANKPITTIEASQELTVKNGYYCYVVDGENYSDEEMCFSVYNANKEVTITPTYSSEYLASLLSTERNSINSTIQRQYGSILNSYENKTGKLIGDGSWYIGILQEKIVNPGELFDTYVYILKKSNTTWAIAAKPSLVISGVEFNTIPKNVVNEANSYLNNYVRNIDG